MSTEREVESAAPVEVIVLNGASSTGKTTLAAALQEVLDDSWLVFGIDTLIAALPLNLLEIHDEAMIEARPRDHQIREGGISFGPDGKILVGIEYRRLEAGWLRGVAAIADAGVRLILDEVFLEGAPGQSRLREALFGRTIAWIGLTCDLQVAEERERERGDRVVGGFAQQWQTVHEGVDYDLVVDSTSSSPQEMAQRIAEFVQPPRE
jgi:chloramphenicol 3-O phosphotransferase